MRAPWAAPLSGFTRHRCAITLATHFGDGIYHFPIEALNGLFAMESTRSPGADDASPLERCAVHVTRRTGYVTSWLAAVSGGRIAGSRVVDGAIEARELWAPELGRCSRPSGAYLGWLRSRVGRFLANASLPPPDSLVLVERTAVVFSKGRVMGLKNKTLSAPVQLAKRRLLRNFDEAVRRPAEAHARAHGLSLAVHSDAALPPLWEQQRRFARARIVLAPMGAAEVLMLAAPRGACVVELQETTMVSLRSGVARAHSDRTYARLASSLGLQYELVRTTNYTASASAVTTALGRCRFGST